jgi:predicted dehydrogenase
VCEVKSLPGIYKNPNIEVICLGRRDEKALKDYAERHNLEDCTQFTGISSGEDLIEHMAGLNNADPENHYVVYISTPVSTHASLASLCGSR